MPLALYTSVGTLGRPRPDGACRNRISLGKVKNRAERCLIEEEEDRTVILRPVETVTAEDKLLLTHPEIAEAIR